MPDHLIALEKISGCFITSGKFEEDVNSKVVAGLFLEIPYVFTKFVSINFQNDSFKFNVDLISRSRR